MNSKTILGKKLVVGIGSALVDILASEDDMFLQKLDTAKGGMIHVESEFITDLLSRIKSKPDIVPGGSACNTIIGIGKLGGKGRFVGKRGNDEFGDLFEAEVIKSGIEPQLSRSSMPTGRVLSIITPDAQRTMFTVLGASSEMTPEEMSENYFKDAAIVHIEGYLLFNRDLLFMALKRAKEAKSLISLDLASFTVVEESKDILEKIVVDYVDILIANEDEAAAYTGHSDEEKAIEALSESVDIAVLKVGKRGSFISVDDNIIKIDAQGTGIAVDTTGAGDLWASGFLFGLVNGYSYEKCGNIASACGYEVCQVVGASIPDEGWKRIYNLL